MLALPALRKLPKNASSTPSPFESYAVNVETWMSLYLPSNTAVLRVSWPSASVDFKTDLADVEHLVVERLGRLRKDRRLRAHVESAALEAAAQRAIGHDLVADLVVEADLRRDRGERLRLVVIRGDGVDDAERVVGVAGVEGDAVLLLAGEAQSAVEVQLAVDRVAAVAEDRVRLRQRLAVRRSEDAVQEDVLDQAAGLAVEVVRAENAVQLRAVVVDELELLRELLVVIGGDDVGDARRASYRSRCCSSSPTSGRR